MCFEIYISVSNCKVWFYFDMFYLNNAREVGNYKHSSIDLAFEFIEF